MPATITPLTAPSRRALPLAAKHAVRDYRLATITQLHKLGSRRLSKVDGRVSFAAPGETTAIAHLLAKWRTDLNRSGDWWAVVRAVAADATDSKLGTYRGPNGGRWAPWVQACDLELQGRIVLAILDAAGIPVDDDVREWVIRPWAKARII